VSFQKIFRSVVQIAVLSAVCASLSGCAAVGVALLGAGATAGATHHMGGVNARTFTEPFIRVELAALAALQRMGITVDSTEKIDDNVTLIKASTPARSIEVQIEVLTPQTTRIRSVAYQAGGLFVDGATGNEIISQTELGLVPVSNGNGMGNGNGNGRPKPVAKRGA
jgi:hypothetical protein